MQSFKPQSSLNLLKFDFNIMVSGSLFCLFLLNTCTKSAGK